MKVENQWFVAFSFKLNTDTFIKPIYYVIFMLTILFRKLINLQWKGNFNIRFFLKPNAQPETTAFQVNIINIFVLSYIDLIV